MSYIRHRFLQIGDTFKSERETQNTHKGMTYKVSHVFNDKGKFRAFITDKHGKDVELDGDWYFTPTAKTVTASSERQKRARLDFYWENHDACFVINKSWHYNFDKTEFFDFENKAHFCGKGMEGVIGRIGRYKKILTDDGWRQPSIEGTYKNLYSKQDFYDYFKDISLDDFRLNGMHRDPQEGIDHLYYMLTIPQYDETLLDISTLDMTDIDWYMRGLKPSLDEFLTLSAEVIFDEPQLSPANKQIVFNIVEAYELLPKSYGPTSVAKLLMGKEKKGNKAVTHLSGTCTTLKQPQLFELANIIESFMYVNGIFVRKDDYKPDEWLGAYEFIGSKMINLTELHKIKEKLQ